MTNDDVLAGVANELASALSSLNMKPELLSEPLNDLGYLSSVDKWVSHAVEHINAAAKALRLVAGNQLLGAADSNSEYTVLLREIAIRYVITSRFLFLINNRSPDVSDRYILEEMVYNESRYLLDESSLFKGFERVVMKPSMINRYTKRTDDVSGYPEHEFMAVRIPTTKNLYYKDEVDPDNGEVWKPMYLYFDVDCPEGISNWMDLPVFKKHRGEEV